ncbi:MAG: hypothetical protein NTX53_11865, partial [candidate division WOR-3 bacterium]|nr:hypothetical protein [candidate division WOR-3 bacterium]
SPDPSPSIASPRVALDDGLQDPDGLRTEAAERNNVAKTTILHDCSTVGVRERSSLDCGSKAAAFPGWADRVGKAGAALPHSKALDAPRSGTVPRASVMPRVVLLALVLAGSALGSLCVWRQPDADISGIFGSGSYKTVFADITDSMKLRIEKRLGTTLDADETQFKYFPVFKGTKRVGTVMTHAGKGQFGAIEVVVAVVEGDSGPIIKAVRIQRDREKAKAALRGKEFLGQFKGKGLTDAFKVGEDIETAAKGAEKASQAVATAARKLLIVYDELGRP